MRAIAIFLSTVVLVLPLAGGLAPLVAPAAAPPSMAAPSLAPLPADLSDADLVLLLAAHVGLHPGRPALAPLAPGETVATLALRLAHRSGAHAATPADFAAFDRLDPRVAAPVATLLAAIGQAWDLQQAATAALPAEDQRALARLVLDGRGATPDALALGDPLDRTALVEAAILVLDTAESLVLPQLQEAAKAGAWPAEPIFDSVGILRIGGTGDDVETMDRLLQIDARGNDTYLNNAGGTTLLADLDPATPDYPIAVSVDFEGDDTYSYGKPFSMGAGFLGVGFTADIAGDDEYNCARLCQGSGSLGFGLLRDFSGGDSHFAGDSSLGHATLIGFLRDESGNDLYTAGTFSGGVGYGRNAVGLLWDRFHEDTYRTILDFTDFRYGWGVNGGSGFFVDEGPAADVYALQALGAHGCNTCTWSAGAGGLGNDDKGGLAHLLMVQNGP